MAKNEGKELIDLRKQIKDNALKSVYVFWGEEDYLRELYIKRITDSVGDSGYPEFNRIVFEEGTPIEEVGAALDMFPFMAERRTIVIKNSGWLSAKRREASADIKDFWVRELERLSDDTILIFDEIEVDKRSAVYKAAVKKGFAAEFKYMSDTDMTDFVVRELMKRKRKINRTDAAYMVDVCQKGMSSLMREIEKLCAYCRENVLRGDIDRVAAKSMEVRVFDITDGIMNKNINQALKALESMKTSNENPFGILYLLYGGFEKMLLAKLLKERRTPYPEIIRQLG